MHLPLLALFGVIASPLIGCGGATSYDEANQDEHMPCDPFMEEEPVAFDPEPAPVCGDGRATRQRTHCSRRCSVGCGTEGICSEVECDYAEERCDGEDLGEWRCQDNGYAGGTLACTDACELDWSGCLACVERPGLRCAEAAFAAGSEVVAIAEGDRVFVISRNDRLHPAPLVGGVVDAELDFRALADPLAEGVLDARRFADGVAYVADGELAHVAVPGWRRRVLGPMGPHRDMLLFVEDDGEGLAVLTGYREQEGMTVNFFAPDGSALELSEPRHFSADRDRLLALPIATADPDVPIDGGLMASDVLVATRYGIFALRDGALLLVRRHPVLSWNGGYVHVHRGVRYRLGSEPEVNLLPPAMDRRPPPEGLGGAAASSATVIEAFGGRLFLDSRHEPGRLGIYLATDER